MAAEQTKRNGITEQMRTTSSSLAGLPPDTAELGITPENYSPLAAEPPRLASIRTSTTTTMRSSDNICSNKSDTTAGASAAFKNWASELHSYMLLEDRNLTAIFNNIGDCQKTASTDLR
eukprot:6036880-Amphidinium_carterae.1